MALMAGQSTVRPSPRRHRRIRVEARVNGADDLHRREWWNCNSGHPQPCQHAPPRHRSSHWPGLPAEQGISAFAALDSREKLEKLCSGAGVLGALRLLDRLGREP
jgi:hypothetical protein